MANHDQHGALPTINGTHLAVVDAACLTAVAAKDIDTLVVESYVFKSLNIVLSEVANDAIADDYRS